MKNQRKYKVTFEDVKTKNQRTVQIQTTDSLTAAKLAYQTFGRKKIKVISAKVIKEDVKENGKTD